MDQETTIDPYESHGDDWVDAQCKESTSMPRLSMPRVVWGVVLTVLSIVGNFTVPWLIEAFNLMIEPFSPSPNGWYLALFGMLFYGVFGGLLIAQSLSVWLISNAYVSSRRRRLLVGLFANMLVITTWVIGVPLAVGAKPPLLTVVFFLGGGTIAYLIIGWILGILLKQTRSGWNQTERRFTSQYSLRSLLVVMVAAAVVAMIGKWISDKTRSSFGWIQVGELVSVILISIYFVLAISCLVWLQYKASRGSNKTFSLAMFLSYLALCPFAFLCVSCGSIEWGRHWREILSFGYFLEAYSIQFGIVLGVALVMPLLPRSDRF